MRTLFSVGILLIASLPLFSQSPIRRVNFKNFTYPAYCVGDTPEKITVKDGEYSKETQEDGYVDRFYFHVFDIAFGDVTGDGQEDAMILTSCNTGGTGQFSEGFVYGLRAGKPVLLARIPGGDRAYGGLRGTRAENGMLVVESNDAGQDGASCCPQFIVTTKYRVVGGKLQQVGKQLKEPIDRAERIRFEKGTSGSTFKVVIGGSDSKKFVVGARAGQSLSVSVDRDTATLRMISEARVTEGIKNFKAVLPKNGDYIFEVLNESATEDEITVNVKIN